MGGHPVEADPTRRARRLVVDARRQAALTVVVVVLGMAVIAYLGSALWQFLSLQPDTVATPAKAAEAAIRAGLADPVELTVLALEHDRYRGDSWRVTWTGSPDAVDQLLRSARSATPLVRCDGREDVYGVGRVALADCRKLDDRWPRPDGAEIERTLVRGVLPDGRAVLTLRAAAA